MRSKTVSRPVVTDIVFTGRRLDDHFRVDVNGDSVWLPGASFKALVKLVVARIRSESGFATISRLTIHRLRKSLGTCGKQLIVIGSGEEYRMTIPKTKIADRVSVAPCFLELEERRIVPKEDLELLRKVCRRRRLVDDDDSRPSRPFGKPNGNGKETKRKRSGN
jgi:hypothetical protein